jgi:hypothetical protein
MTKDFLDSLRAILNDFRSGKLSNTAFTERRQRLSNDELKWIAQESTRMLWRMRSPEAASWLLPFAPGSLPTTNLQTLTSSLLPYL